MTESRRSAIPIHPLFIGVYPALTLCYLNIQEIQLAAIWQALVTSLVITVIVALLYTLIFRSWSRAALLIMRAWFARRSKSLAIKR